MNLDDLKTAWKVYDRKLQSTQAINEKIIISMITERSDTRFSKVRKQYVIGFLWMFVCAAFGILVILTNPFDYQQTIQYIPMVIFITGLAILMGGMTTRYFALQKIIISHNNIGEALKQVIAEYEKPRKFLYYTVIVFLFSQAFLFPLSFLPRSIEIRGLWPALGERLIPISIAVLMLLAAYKLGAFKTRHVDKFREDLNELESLKAMSAELSEN
ncbi:MAG: hypothetical protein WD824_00615 [Cyclobacteriaceae bacterium]